MTYKVVVEEAQSRMNVLQRNAQSNRMCYTSNTGHKMEDEWGCKGIVSWTCADILCYHVIKRRRR